MYKNVFDSGCTYIATYRFLSGQRVNELYQMYPEASWKLRRLSQDVGARELNYWSNTMFQVCTSSNPKYLVNISEKCDAWAKDKSYSLGSPVNSYCSSAPFKEKPKCIEKIRKIIGYYALQIVGEFPAGISVGALRKALVGRPNESTYDVLNRCRILGSQGLHLHTGMPAWSLEYARTDKEFVELVYWFYNEQVSWTGESSIANDYKLKVPDGEVVFIVDGQNIAVNQVDYLLTEELGGNSVDSMIVVDDGKQEQLWKLVKEKVQSFEFIGCTRTVNGKSGADFDLVSVVAREYAKGIRKFIFASSDADFSRLPAIYSDAEFLFVCQKSATSTAWVEQMSSMGVKHFFTDESLSGWNRKIYLTNLIKHALQDCDSETLNDELKWNTLVLSQGYPQGIVSDKARDALLMERRKQLEDKNERTEENVVGG